MNTIKKTFVTRKWSTVESNGTRIRGAMCIAYRPRVYICHNESNGDFFWKGWLYRM